MFLQFNHPAESDGTIPQLAERIVDLRHWGNLSDRLDLVLGGKLEHLRGPGRAALARARDSLLLQQAEDARGDTGSNANEVQTAVELEGGDVLVPGSLLIRGVQDEVKLVAVLLDVLHITAVDALVRTHRLGVLELAAAGEGRHIAAPSLVELDGKVAQAADPDDTHFGIVSNVEGDQRGKDGVSSAQERPGSVGVHPLGDRDRSTGTAAHTLRKTTMAAVNADAPLGANHRQIHLAVITLPTVAGEITQTDAVTHLVEGRWHLGADLDHLADDLMAANKRERRHPPPVLEHGQVATLSAPTTRVPRSVPTLAPPSPPAIPLLTAPATASATVCTSAPS